MERWRPLIIYNFPWQQISRKNMHNRTVHSKNQWTCTYTCPLYQVIQPDASKRLLKEKSLDIGTKTQIIRILSPSFIWCLMSIGHLLSQIKLILQYEVSSTMPHEQKSSIKPNQTDFTI